MGNPPYKPRGSGQEKPVPQNLLFWSAVMAISAAILVVGLSILFYYLFLRPSGPIVPGGASQLVEIGKISFAAVAGLGGVVALVISFKRQKLSEFGHERDKQRMFNERFSSAVGQLGESSSAPVRIGGVYSLAKLADDWPTDRQRCIDVLCAYLRFPFDSDEKILEIEVRRTLASVIQEHLKIDATVHWGDNTFDLRGASLDDLSLADVVLTGGRLILSNCSVKTGKFDLSGIYLESGTIDATGLTMTGGQLDIRKTRLRGGQFLFGGARFSGGNLSLADSIVYKGRLCFDGAKIDGAELDLSELEIWCPNKRFGEETRLSLNNIEMADGILNLHYSRLVAADTPGYQRTKSDIDDYVVMEMNDATMTGGRISLRDTELTLGKVSFCRLTMSGGVLDFGRTQICERAQIELRVLNLRGGSIDFSDTWIGSARHRAAPSIGHSWVQELKKEKKVESRDVVWVYGHPCGHVDLSNSEIEAGLVKFGDCVLNGAIVLLYGLVMSGGRIEFTLCVGKNSVVSLWNSDLGGDAVIIFENNLIESPVVIYSQYCGGLGEHVLLSDRSCLLEVSAVD